MAEKNLKDIKSLLKKSPIRKYLSENASNKIIFENERESLFNIDEILSANEENLTSPLKVVILGEVKAGKSTLVNALVGKKVSYTNVVEATSSILEIKYSSNENIELKKKDGTSEKVNSLIVLDELIDSNRNNQDFFDEIEKILIELKMSRLKEITIVDTPGLNTITDENEKRTYNYIANADVILWVLNVHHLGQSDVSDKVDEILDYGKPIVCIVNRIDEVGADVESIISYVKNEMGYMFEEVFAISAKYAWDSQITNDKEKLEKSNVYRLYEYLINNIERNSKQIQRESISESTKIQVDKDIYIHEQSKNKIGDLLRKYREDILEINKFNNSLKNNISNKLEEWIDIEFFEEEKYMLLNCTNPNEFHNIVREISNDNYINKVIQLKYNKLNNYILQQWEDYTNRSLSRQINDLINNLPVSSDRAIRMEDSTHSILSQKTIGKTKSNYDNVKALSMAILSGYALSLFSPILAVGAAGGAVGAAVYKFFDGSKEEAELYNKVNLLVTRLKLRLKNDVSNILLTNLKESSDNYYNQSREILSSLLSENSISIDEFENIYTDLENYIYELRRLKMDISEINYEDSSKNIDDNINIDIEIDNIMKELL